MAIHNTVCMCVVLAELMRKTEVGIFQSLIETFSAIPP